MPTSPGPWGCHNAERKAGYWAPDGYKMAQAGECGHKVVLPQMRWIADTSTRECHNEDRAVDARCAGCEKVLT